MLHRFPELQDVRLRRGGLPPRIGGWFLGQPSVSAITLWSTVWLGVKAALDEELLLHEARHVTHFRAHRGFPILYAWESLRRGYHQNRFEVDARSWAAQRMRGSAPP